MTILAYIILLVVLLILSGFFSGTETALFNLRTHRENIHHDIAKMLKAPRRLLVSLLTGNTIVNVLMAAFAALLASKFASQLQLPEYAIVLTEVILITVVVVIFGEIIPKIIAIRKSNDYVRYARLPLKFFSYVLYPLSGVLHGITKIILKILPIKKERIFDSEEELKILTQVSEEQGTLQTEESEMIQSIYEFHKKSVHEVMTPRVDMVALSSKSSLQDVIDLIREKQFSKIPIYKENIDDIKGILFAKDLIPFLSAEDPGILLTALARTPYFVPESKELDELLSEFREKKTSIAIVVDEWGGTSGLVTLEDVVEEVIGELIDPYDKDNPKIKKQKDGIILVDAKMGIYDIEEETGIEFPTERDYDTLGGFIIQEMKDFSKPGDKIQYAGQEFTVIKVDGSRIEQVKIEPLQDPSDPQTEPQD
ncbi:MAG: hemolysin family protein [Fidelibacterota bacterium]